MSSDRALWRVTYALHQSRHTEGYDIALPLAGPERRQLEERARKETRSVSNYVTKLVLDQVARRR